MGNISGQQAPCSSTLQFDPSSSYALAYCINNYYHPGYFRDPPDAMMKNDALRVTNALIQKGAVRGKSAKIISADEDSCSYKDIKSTLLEQAELVKENGVFFLFFAGHVKLVKGKCGLAPSDYRETEETHITGDVLIQWLKEANHKGTHTVIILDCCHAGGVGSTIAEFNENNSIPGLHILASCEADEIYSVIPTLGNSIFSYFLGYAIETTTFEPGQLPLYAIHDKLYKPTVALSSLLIGYEKGKLWKYEVTPQYIRKRGGDSSSIKEVLLLYDDSLTTPSDLDTRCSSWILSDCTNALKCLQEENVLQLVKVKETALCAMMYSVASIELFFEKQRKAPKRAHRNVCITAFSQVHAAIKMVDEDATFTLQDCSNALHQYELVVGTDAEDTAHITKKRQQLLKQM